MYEEAPTSYPFYCYGTFGRLRRVWSGLDPSASRPLWGRTRHFPAHTTLPALHISLSPTPPRLDTAAANSHCLRWTVYQVFTLEYTCGYVIGVYELARSTV